MVDTDRRVRRTRRALHDALLTLMIEKSYDAVTVQDIIDRADVGRSTFYSHFTDKRDLLDSGFEDLNQLLAQPPSAARGREGMLRFSLPLFQHAHAHQRLAQALVTRRGASPVQDRFHQVLTSTIRAELDELVAQHQGAVRADDLTVDYIAGALQAVITSWLDTAPHKTPREVDALFHTLVDPGLRAALQLDRRMSPPHLASKCHVDENGSADAIADFPSWLIQTVDVHIAALRRRLGGPDCSGPRSRGWRSRSPGFGRATSTTITGSCWPDVARVDAVEPTSLPSTSRSATSCPLFDDVAARVDELPGIGPISAATLAPDADASPAEEARKRSSRSAAPCW